MYTPFQTLSAILGTAWWPFWMLQAMRRYRQWGSAPGTARLVLRFCYTRYFLGSKFLSFVLESARINSNQKGYKNHPQHVRYGPSFLTSMFVRTTEVLTSWSWAALGSIQHELGVNLFLVAEQFYKQVCVYVCGSVCRQHLILMPQVSCKWNETNKQK